MSDNLRLEPIRGFSIDESVTLRKKSKGKTPNPPPITAFKLRKATLTRQAEVDKLLPEGGKKQQKRDKSPSSTTSRVTAASTDVSRDEETIELITPEKTNLLSSVSCPLLFAVGFAIQTSVFHVIWLFYLYPHFRSIVPVIVQGVLSSCYHFQQDTCENPLI